MSFLKKMNLDTLKAVVDDGKAQVANIASNVNVDGAMEAARKAAGDGAAAMAKAIEGVAGKKQEDSPEEADYRSFILLLWCLAAADGTISDAERNMLHEISEAIDSDYESYAESLEREFMERLAVSASEFGQDNAAKVEAQRTIETAGLDTFDAKLLCWNLIALANSDGLDDKEVDLIRFVAEKTGVGTATFEEFRNYGDAIVELDRCCAEMKSSSLSYAEVAPIIEELTERKNSIIAAAEALVADR